MHLRRERATATSLCVYVCVCMCVCRNRRYGHSHTGKVFHRARVDTLAALGSGNLHQLCAPHPCKNSAPALLR